MGKSRWTVSAWPPSTRWPGTTRGARRCWPIVTRWSASDAEEPRPREPNGRGDGRPPALTGHPWRPNDSEIVPRLPGRRRRPFASPMGIVLSLAFLQAGAIGPRPPSASSRTGRQSQLTRRLARCSARDSPAGVGDAEAATRLISSIEVERTGGLRAWAGVVASGRRRLAARPQARAGGGVDHRRGPT